MFFSTRDQNVKIPFSKTLLEGISEDGGLFLPQNIPTLRADDGLLSLSYEELACKILAPYLDDFSIEELQSALKEAYDEKHFSEKIIEVKNFGEFSCMELFHGPTLTFKDMALSLLPHLMVIAKNKHKEVKQVKILTATSGDTGSAVLSSFSRVKDISISVLYPDGGVAPIQEKQMLYFTSSSSRAYAVSKANFDDCQSLVKELLIKEKDEGFTSANSINIGRLLPQIVYYYYTYLELVRSKAIKLGDKIDFVVPTGNFGDIFAGYLAKMMSLPIGSLVVASNENKVLCDFFKTGVYDIRRKFIKTNSPSMDILVSSNLERLLYLVIRSDKEVASLMEELKTKKEFSVKPEYLEKLQETFLAYNASEIETEEAIKSCYRKYHYVLDPHSAVGYHVYDKFIKNTCKNHTVLVLTASPLKFPSTICHSLGLDFTSDMNALDVLTSHASITIPASLRKVLDCKTPKFLLSKENVRNELFAHHEYEVKTPGSSANLGPGFDVLGLSLNIYNVFTFKESDTMATKGFPDLGTKENLVLTSYEYVFTKLGIELIPSLITEVKNGVPVSRGMGSSSSSILAGLLGANAILKNKLSKEEIYEMAVDIEGHPDNVSPALFGGLMANIKENGKYHPVKLKISPNLRFLLMVPDYKVSTEDARGLLPKEYPLSVITSNASRLAILPYALENGDIDLLKEAIIDLVHVPYRKGLIKDFDLLSDIVTKKYGLPLTISGSGPTLIAFYSFKEEDLVDKLIKELRKTSFSSPISFIQASSDEEGSIIMEKSYE